MLISVNVGGRKANKSALIVNRKGLEMETKQDIEVIILMSMQAESVCAWK